MLLANLTRICVAFHAASSLVLAKTEHGTAFQLQPRENQRIRTDLRYEVSNHNGYNIHQSHQQAQSMDRLRVDLMRTKLSVKTAEDKTKRLEKELVEMRWKYDEAQKQLREEREKRAQEKEQVNQSRAQGHQQKKGSNQIPKQRTESQDKVSPKIQPCPSEDLPPFAAALFANAEREEKEKRMQKMGLIEQADDSLAGAFTSPRRVDVDALLSHHTVQETQLDEGPVAVGPGDLASAVVLGAEGNLTSPFPAGVTTKARRASGSPPSIDMKGETNRGKDDQLQMLVEKCAQLTRQREILERKLTLSQADRVIDIKGKEQLEEEERYRKEREEWTREKEEFEGQLKSLMSERDGLASQLEDHNSIPNATKLLCGLIRDKLVQISKGVTRKGPGRARDRILEVGGGAVTSTSNRRGDRGRPHRLKSASLRLLQKLKDAYSQRNNILAADSQEDAPPADEGDSARPADPLLVRKKRHGPGLLRPVESIASKRARRRKDGSASSGPEEVPAFLRKEGDS